MKQRPDELVAMVLVFLILALPGALSARERRGANIIVTLKDGHFSAGELIAVKPDSLLLLAGKDESVDLVGIRSIRIIRKSKALLGTGCGYLASLVATTIYAKIIAADDDMAGLSGLVFLPAGLGIGLLVGAHAGKDKTIQLDGKSESEVRQALSYLRGKARVRDYK